jgi:hypothetical protein
MSIHRSALPLFLVLACLTSCGTSRKYLRVSSHPDGATIFVNGEPRGQTNVQTLLVDLGDSGTATVRLEKDGFQSAGVAVTDESPDSVAFFLEESPRNDAILKRLSNLERQMDQIVTQIDKAERESAKKP